MRTKLLYGAIVAGLLALAYAFTAAPPPAAAGELKNLQVFPKETSKKDIKKAMKGLADALGVECDYCHDMDDMAKDTEHKEAGRKMMRMSMELNQKYFAGKQRITCNTCHNGNKEPK
jgi:hypothetical protein